MYGRVIGSSTELRGFVREAVGDVYRYALALTVSATRAEQLASAAALRLARHVDAVGAAPVSTARLNLVVRREVLDGLPRRRRRHHHHATSPPELVGGPAPSALSALAALDVEERVALVLRHYDGLLLPDIAAALSISYPDAEAILRSARERLAPVIDAYDDGTGADPYARLVRSVPGPADALADRVWVAVEAALVPDYAEDDGWTVPDVRQGEDPLGWDGFDAVPVPEHHVPPVREARRVGTTLLLGAGALAALLAVAALTAPGSGKDRAPGTAGTAAPEGSSSPPATTVPADGATVPSGPGTRGQQPPAEPDLLIDPGAAAPHPPDRVEALSEPAIGPDPPRLADVAVRIRFHDGTSQVVVRRVAPDGGSEVWLVAVAGRVRDATVEDPELLQAWAVDGDGVVLSMRVAGHPDTRVVAGLRPGGSGTWLRLPDGAEPLKARADGAIVCVEPGPEGLNLTTYQVLG